jgi:hypothetical protein
MTCDRVARFGRRGSAARLRRVDFLAHEGRARNCLPYIDPRNETTRSRPPPLWGQTLAKLKRFAARVCELPPGESDYTKERLRADVRTALIGEGREPDDRLIDEAIGA